MVDALGDPGHIIDHYIARAPVTAYAAATTLYHYAASENTDLAVPPSEWRTMLIRLISKSDIDNRAKLAFVFPAEVAACCLIEWRPDGMQALRQIAAAGKVGGGA